jgi:hypothetical protein
MWVAQGRFQSGVGWSGGFTLMTLDVKSPTMAGKVDKIIPAINPDENDKAQISIENADHLYKEIRIDNLFTNKDGEEVALKLGAEVDLTIAADEKDTVKS